MKLLKSCKWIFLVVVYLSVTFCDEQEKMLIAVNDFANEGITTSEVRILTDRLRSELIMSKKFRVFERNEMDRILKEQGFQQSGACDDRSCLVEIGQLLGAQRMISGTMGYIGKIYTLTARMIDVKTGEILFSANIDCNKCDMNVLLTKSIKELARQIIDKSFPEETESVTDLSDQSAEDQTKKKPLIKRAAFWIPAGAIIIGGAAVAGYLYLNGDDKEEPVVETGGIIIEWN